MKHSESLEMHPVPALCGTAAESPAAGFAHKTVSEAESRGALAPSQSGPGQRDTPVDEPRRPSAAGDMSRLFSLSVYNT